MTSIGTSSEVLFEEQLRPRGRSWLWLPPVLVITFLAIAPVIAPIALVAWFVNVVRFWRASVRIDADHIWVGKRGARLSAVDLTTLGRAQNTWPWRVFSRRWLGANPIWTSDSVGVRGFDAGKPFWVSIGTNRRDELVDVLQRAVPPARQQMAAWTVSAAATIAPPGWHPDPWDPVNTLRWWDGAQWTGWTHPPITAPSATAATAAPAAPASQRSPGAPDPSTPSGEAGGT